MYGKTFVNRYNLSSKLNQVDTDGVEITAHSSGVESVMREDDSADSISIEDALLNAPNTEKDFIRIRAVLE